jgi:hypothetical protein
MVMQLCDSLLITRIRDCGPALSEEDIRAFEQEIGVSLPCDYRWFLRSFNGGGYYDQEFIHFPMPGGPVGDFIGFIGLAGINLDYDRRWGDIRHMLEVHPFLIPSCLLPIGDTGGVEWLLLDVHDGGKMYLWTRDLDFALEGNRYFLASSFTEFALGCYYMSEEEREASEFEKQEPFLSIAIQRNKEFIRYLDDGFPLFETNEQEQTPLYVACGSLNYEAAEELLRRGADPDDGDRRRGYPPLYAAAAPGAGELAKLLLSYGASPYMDADKTRPILENLPTVPTKYMRDIFESAKGKI